MADVGNVVEVVGGLVEEAPDAHDVLVQADSAESMIGIDDDICDGIMRVRMVSSFRRDERVEPLNIKIVQIITRRIVGNGKLFISITKLIELD